MKDTLTTLIYQALDNLGNKITGGSVPVDRIRIERTRDSKHGDFACNIAMVLARQAGKNPRELAQMIVENLPENDAIRQTDIAGPGFINFFLNQASAASVIADILEQGAAFGSSSAHNGQRIHLEFVSANPTGPLHVGHGRGAAYGDCIARLLELVGFTVHREYYVNDAGRQMDILATSLWLRYLQAQGEEIPFPENAYQGDYIREAAQSLITSVGDRFSVPAGDLLCAIPEKATRDPERHLDALIEAAKHLLGDTDYQMVQDHVLQSQLADIRDDLTAFGVSYDEWFSERSLVDEGLVGKAVQFLTDHNHTYEQEGAVWFRATDLGDDKDRVLIRSNGAHTYFAADVAYHLNKIERGYHTLVNVWGADHHGYVKRLSLAVRALAGEDVTISIPLVQFANLYRGEERLSMSTRAGQYVTLRELREEVGVDATRFFYVSRSCDQHLDFDLELAKSRKNDNPVYYTQYAHARICGVFDQLDEKGLSFDKQAGLENLARLEEDHEKALLKTLSGFPEVVEQAAVQYSPHKICFYLLSLADQFHSYYNAHMFLVDDNDLRNARLCLVSTVGQVIRNAFSLIGVSAPDHM